MRMLEIDRVIARTPCLAIELPRDDRREEMRFLDAHQIELLADAIDERYHALIYMAAYTGRGGPSSLVSELSVSTCSGAR